MLIKLCSLRTILFAFTVIIFFHTTQSYGANGITFTARADLANVGTHFDMTFDTNNNPARLYPTWVSVARNGVYFILEGGQETVRITCNTTTCTFFVPGLTTIGTYDLEFYIGSPVPVSFQDTADTTENIPNWWSSRQLVLYERDIFSGNTNIAFRFTNVPAGITSFALGIYTDIDYTGIYQGGAGPLCVNEGPGTFLCAIMALPALCTIQFGTGCDGNYSYYFGLNLVTIIAGPYDATHENLTAYQEGDYFGNFNYDQGMSLQQRLDLTTFLFENPTACAYESPEPYYCWNMAYYIRWTQRYRDDFEALLKTTGQFSVTKQGPNALVSISVPRLPVGLRGYGVKIAYYPTSAPTNVIELPVECAVNTCTPLNLLGVNPDDYQFELRLYNNHPQITYYDYNLDRDVTFGEELYKTIKYTRVTNRRVFYNRSSSSVFGNGSGNPVNAIDDTKIALLPGQTTSVNSYTNYIKGINGIVIDINGETGNMTASDFLFEKWNGIVSTGFVPLSALATITKIQLSSNLTRVKIEFSDHTIQNTWLKVSVLANSRTGLLKNDVFYFGNAAADMYIGNTGNPTTIRVNATDTSRVRQNQSIAANSVVISNYYDLNKDGRVNATDTSLVRQHQMLNVLRYFTAP